MGGKNYVSINTAELQIADPSLHFEVTEVAAVSCRSILCKKMQANSILLRVGEHLLVTTESNECQVIKVSQFFAICYHNQYHNFVKGQLYIRPSNNPVHSYSDNQLTCPSAHVVTLPASKILRKVMLYPNPENLSSPTSYVILDYYRPRLPFDLQDTVVPVYPETNDMVQVCGNNDELWLGYVNSVDRLTETCNMNFYIEDPTCPGRYKQESFGRLSVNTVHWSSIISICHGNWSSNQRYWYPEENDV